MDKFTVNVFSYLQEHNIKKAALARACDVPNQTVNHWKSRGIPKRHAVTIAKFLKLDVKYLLGEIKEPLPPIQVVPVIGTSSCGVPSASEFHHDPDFDEAVYYAGPQRVYAVKAIGDSMEDYIFEDDIVICEALHNNGIEEGEVVHYTYNWGSPNAGESGIKVFKRYKGGERDGMPYLKPLNGKYDPIDVEHPEFLRLARVLSVQKPKRKF